jgi:hypothetical protein
MYPTRLVILRPVMPYTKLTQASSYAVQIQAQLGRLLETRIQVILVLLFQRSVALCTVPVIVSNTVFKIDRAAFKTLYLKLVDEWDYSLFCFIWLLTGHVVSPRPGPLLHAYISTVCGTWVVACSTISSHLRIDLHHVHHLRSFQGKDHSPRQGKSFNQVNPLSTHSTC